MRKRYQLLNVDVDVTERRRTRENNIRETSTWECIMNFSLFLSVGNYLMVCMTLVQWSFGMDPKFTHSPLHFDLLDNYFMFPYFPS